MSEPNNVIDGLIIDEVTYDIQDTAAQEDILELKSAINFDKTATPGYIFTATNDGNGSQWSPVGLPTDEQTAQAVSDWLDDHPEATTTVEDGSLTEAKFSSALALKAIKDYVTPQMFGAKGDGETDDAEAIQAAITYSRQNNIGVYLPYGIYCVSSTIELNDLNVFEMNPQAVIKATASMDYVIDFRVRVSYIVERPQIINLRVDGNSVATNGVLVRAIVHTGTTNINGLEVKNCIENGVVFDQCQGGIFQAIRSYDNGGDGIQSFGSSNAKFISLSSMANGGDGIVFSPAINGAVGSGACYVFGAHAEQNDGDGIHFINGTGLVSVYSGWLEGNKQIPIHIENNSKCTITGMYIVWAVAQPWAVINSDFAIIRDVECQAGTGGIYIPTVNGKSIIENVQTYNQTFDSNLIIGNHVSEKLGANLIVNGDMQLDNSGSNGYDIYYCTATYQNTEKVESGKTYSLKAVVTSNGFALRKGGTTGLTPGILYKMTCRFYYIGEGCSVRVVANNVPDNKAVYSDLKDVTPNQWEEITGYFYATTSGETRFTLSTVINNPKNDDIFYISKMYCQPCYAKEQVATKIMGSQKLYETVEPKIMA